MTFRGLYYEKITKRHGYRKGKNVLKNKNFKHKEAATTMTKNRETYD